MKEVEALIYDLINGDKHIITYKEIKSIVKCMEYMNIPKYSIEYIDYTVNCNIVILFFAFIQNFRYCIKNKKFVNSIIYDSFLSKLSDIYSIKNFNIFYNVFVSSNTPIGGSIKNSKYVKFGPVFNQPLGDSIKNAIHVTFGSNFNQPLGESIKNATHVQFGREFNQLLGELINENAYVVANYECYL